MRPTKCGVSGGARVHLRRSTDPLPLGAPRHPPATTPTTSAKHREPPSKEEWPGRPREWRPKGLDEGIEAWVPRAALPRV